MELLSIFSKIGDWISDQTTALVISIAFSFASGFVAKKGWSTIIDKIAKKGKVISKKIELALIEGADVAAASTVFLEGIDASINDDGDIDQNSLKEALAAGKEVYVEAKDVVAVFKPKTALKALSPKPPEVKSKKVVNKRPKHKHR